MKQTTDTERRTDNLTVIVGDSIIHFQELIQLPVEDQEEYRRRENHKPTSPNPQQQNTDSLC